MCSVFDTFLFSMEPLCLTKFLVGVCRHEAPAGGEWRVLDVLPGMPQAKVGRGHGEDGCDKMFLFKKTEEKKQSTKKRCFGLKKKVPVRESPRLDPRLPNGRRLGGTHMHMDGGPDMEPEVSNMTTWN